nr:hypothetical protein [Tanacetum cinerariifolium]
GDKVGIEPVILELLDLEMEKERPLSSLVNKGVPADGIEMLIDGRKWVSNLRGSSGQNAFNIMELETNYGVVAVIVEYVEVHFDVNHDDDGLVVCNQLLQECKRYEMAESLVLGTNKYIWYRSFDEQGFCLSDGNWPMKNGVNYFVVGGIVSMSQFNHSVSSQRMVEEEVCNAPELVPIPLGTKGDTDESTELILNIFNSDNSFESSYGESGKQGTDGNIRL